MIAHLLAFYGALVALLPLLLALAALTILAFVLDAHSTEDKW